VAIFGPLAFLVFGGGEGLSADSKRYLRWALFSVVLLPVGVLLRFVPVISTQQGGGAIRLDPPPHEMPAQGAMMLRGLSVRDGVMILRTDPKMLANIASPYTACDNQDWVYPPSHFLDPDGNGMDFTLNGPDLLHFQDDKGGFADIEWEGSRFVLVDSHSGGVSQSARLPSVFGVSAGRAGDFLLILSPLLAFVLITWFARQQTGGAAAGSLVFSATLQQFAIIVLIFVAWSAPAHFDEVSGGLMMLFLLIITVCFGAGIAILGWHLRRMANQIENQGHNGVDSDHRNPGVNC
jgi:hypothetical protein